MSRQAAPRQALWVVASGDDRLEAGGRVAFTLITSVAAALGIGALSPGISSTGSWIA